MSSDCQDFDGKHERRYPLYREQCGGLESTSISEIEVGYDTKELGAYIISECKVLTGVLG